MTRIGRMPTSRGSLGYDDRYGQLVILVGAGHHPDI
jgi:hypothetical protein